MTDVKLLPNDRITPLVQATAQATEAAITNALPVDRMLGVMKKYGRLP